MATRRSRRLAEPQTEAVQSFESRMRQARQSFGWQGTESVPSQVKCGAVGSRPPWSFAALLPNLRCDFRAAVENMFAAAALALLSIINCSRGAFRARCRGGIAPSILREIQSEASSLVLSAVHLSALHAPVYLGLDASYQ
jgi:hypothetical protein